MTKLDGSESDPKESEAKYSGSGVRTPKISMCHRINHVVVVIRTTVSV